MAFVVLQHLAAEQPSLLVPLLSRATTMPVAEAEDGMAVRPDNVYVLPPDASMTLRNGLLSLEKRKRTRGEPLPIDRFFASLAVDQSALAIAVVLSGNASDGAVGLKQIHAEGGITIVQSERSARNPGMPRAALATGVADLVLAPEEIGRELNRIAKRLASAPTDDAEADWQKIFHVLQDRHRVNFAEFKIGTIARRVHRRMLLERRSNLSAYAEYVARNESESAALFEDLLIGVTAFFRDPDVFESLETKVAPRLLAEKKGQGPIRIWVPGCATGEEVYSIGIVLLEVASKLSIPVTLNLFGTDLSQNAIASARAACYSAAQLEHLSPERRERYFRRVDGGYQVVKVLRDMCVFACHNLGADAPFSRMDLLSCRNVLIYLAENLQKRVLPGFHYALRDGGFLMLGQSESLGDAQSLFTAVDGRARLYEKRPGHPAGATADGWSEVPRQISTARAMQPATRPIRANGRMAERIAASEYGPAWLLVDESYRLIESHGHIDPFVRMQAGPATLDVLQIIREEARSEVQRLLGSASDGGETLRSDPIRLTSDETARVDVRRIVDPDGNGHSFLIVFVLAAAGAHDGSAQRSAQEDAGGETAKLRRELQLATERLQWIINERDAAIHDLTCANEEVRSSNEELQSINEEVRTSKEEVEAANEELTTLNEELGSRNEQLRRLSDDLNNVLLSTDIPIVMADDRLLVRRMTAAAEALLNVGPGDLGRPLREVCSRFKTGEVQSAVERVIKTLAPQELDLQDKDGCWRSLRFRPYRTSENRIEGVILAFIDIDELRREQLKADHARRFAEAVVETVSTPLVVVDPRLQIRLANAAFNALFGGKSANVRGQKLFAAARGAWEEKLKAALATTIETGRTVENLEIEHRTRTAGLRVLSFSTRLVKPDGDAEILLAVEDVTERKRSERRLLSERERLREQVSAGAAELKTTAAGLQKEAIHRQKTEAALYESETALHRNREELRALTAQLLHAQDEERRRVSRELHDDLSQKMAKLQFDIERLQDPAHANPTGLRNKLESLREQAGALADDVRRIAHQLHPSMLDHLGLTVALRSYCRDFSVREGISVKFTSAVASTLKPSPEVASSVYRILQEALRNVVKHAGDGVSVAVTLTAEKGELRLRIRDNGAGFVPSSVRGKGGLGFVSMQERVRLLHGDLRVRSGPNKGATIEVMVPLPKRR